MKRSMRPRFTACSNLNETLIVHYNVAQTSSNLSMKFVEFFARELSPAEIDKLIDKLKEPKTDKGI